MDDGLSLLAEVFEHYFPVAFVFLARLDLEIDGFEFRLCIVWTFLQISFRLESKDVFVDITRIYWRCQKWIGRHEHNIFLIWSLIIKLLWYSESHLSWMSHFALHDSWPFRWIWVEVSVAVVAWALSFVYRRIPEIKLSLLVQSRTTSAHIFSISF